MPEQACVLRPSSAEWDSDRLSISSFQAFTETGRRRTLGLLRPKEEALARRMEVVEVVKRANKPLPLIRLSNTYSLQTMGV